MKRWLISSFSLISLPALAENPNFDSFYLLGRSHFAASQNYQVENRNCEVAGMSAHGNADFKRLDLTVEAKAQGGAFECLQSLESKAMVFGMRMKSEQFTVDGVIFRQEYFSTKASPLVTFNISPSFSLGIELNFENVEMKTIDSRYGASTHFTTVSASIHQDNWEFTLAHADRYRNYQYPELDIPRETTLNVRVRPAPSVTVGARMKRVDYPGIASGDDDDLQAEVSTGLIAAAQVMDMFSGELAYMITSSDNGDPDTKGNTLSMMLGGSFNPSMKAGVTVDIVETSDEIADTSLTTFAVVFGYAQ